MNPKFPSSLPGPSLNAFELTQRDTMIRTQFVTGRARQRNTYDNVPPLFKARWYLTSGETRVFEAWYRSIGNGSDWFDISVKLPNGYAERTARFTGVYSGPEPWGNSNTWIITANLELQELPTFTGDEYLYDAIGVEYADVFDETVNGFLPE
jgi:hypothetical protein